VCVSSVEPIANGANYGAIAERCLAGRVPTPFTSGATRWPTEFKYPVTAAKARTLDASLQGFPLLPQRDVFENHSLVPVTGQGLRSRNQEDCFQHAVVLSCAACENQATHGRMQFWREKA
jgi:hypothetical protein